MVGGGGVSSARAGAVEMSMSSSTHNPWPALAALRFVLAVVVMVSHLSWFAPGLPDGGALAAVLGFLVVSGYSIAASLEREPAGFYRRRLRRILPVYLAACALSLLPVALGPVVDATGYVWAVPAPAEVVCNLVFLQGFACGPLTSNPVVWSLSVEAACYAAAPFLRRWTAAALALVSLAAFLLIPPEPVYYSRMTGGGALVLLAWAWLAGFLLWRAGLRFTLPVPRRLCLWLGDVSYPLYLVHIPAYLGLWALGVRAPVLLAAGALALAVLAQAVERKARAAAERGRARDERHAADDRRSLVDAGGDLSVLLGGKQASAPE